MDGAAGRRGAGRADRLDPDGRARRLASPVGARQRTLAGMDVRDRVAATGLLEPGRPAIVLLSGGRDSVCLLDVAAALLGADLVRALHVNYGLRDEADGDEAHC